MFGLLLCLCVALLYQIHFTLWRFNALRGLFLKSMQHLDLFPKLSRSDLIEYRSDGGTVTSMGAFPDTVYKGVNGSWNLFLAGTFSSRRTWRLRFWHRAGGAIQLTMEQVRFKIVGGGDQRWWVSSHESDSGIDR
jgi:hypothetical protein